MKSFGSFLNEGSIPGQKRGPYQNTRVMRDKISPKSINKAGTAILQGWKKRGGVNVGAISSELADRGVGDGDESKEISLDATTQKSRDAVIKNKNDILDMMDVPESERDETEITVNNSKEEKLKAQEDKYRKLKDKWEKKKEKFFSIIDPESRLGKAVDAFFKAQPSPFPGMGDEAETVFDVVNDLEKLRAGSKAAKYGRKETKAREKAEKASKEAEEKAEKEREERKKREEKRKKKTQKEEYKSLRSCISEIWIKT